MRLLPIDELNAFETSLKAGEKKEVKRLLDDALDFLLIAYFNGSQDAAEMLGLELEPDIDKAREAINLKVAGKDYAERLREYGESGDLESILRVLDTDMTRVYNTAVLDTAQGRATMKTWNTMLDDRVRDTHEPLEGVTIPIDAEFYTWDGDKALAPGGFGKAENNVNCRCLLSVS